MFWQLSKEVRESQSAITGLLQRILNYFIHTIYIQHKSYKLKQELRLAVNYDRWEELALELDKLHGINKWKANPRSNMYDYRNTQYLCEFLMRLREKGLTKGIVHTLRCSLQK